MGCVNLSCKNSRVGFACNNNKYLAAINLHVGVASKIVHLIVGDTNTLLNALSYSKQFTGIAKFYIESTANLE